MDQTPLPFSFTGGQTYDTTNFPTVWVRGGASGLDKRQCTAQLTIFADGEPRVKPLLIFRGKGKCISMREQLQYDRRVTVRFQPNAWCDQNVMEYWIKNCWKPHVKEETLLVLDVHKAQKTDQIQDLLTKECNTTPQFVPPGLTNVLQPLDVSYNAPFKKRVESQALRHLQDNLEGYLHGKFTAGERRVLLKKWVGAAWEELVQDKEIAVRSFKKCGISVAADGSEDFEIHLEGQGLEDYKIAEMDDHSNSDPFADASGSDSDSFADVSQSGSDSDPYADVSQSGSDSDPYADVSADSDSDN